MDKETRELIGALKEANENNRRLLNLVRRLHFSVSNTRVIEMEDDAADNSREENFFRG